MLNLIEIAMADWKVVPDSDLTAVCQRARMMAASKPSSQGFTPLATTAEVLAAWKEISQKAYHNRYWSERRAHDARVKEGQVLPDSIPSSLDPQEKEAFWENFYRTAGIQRLR